MEDTVENRNQITIEVTAISNRLAELAREVVQIDYDVSNLLHGARDSLADALIKLRKLPFHMREENL